MRVLAMLIVSVTFLGACDRKPQTPLPNAVADGFTHFGSLEDFIGIDSLWTGESQDKVYPLGQSGEFVLPFMSHVVVEKVVHGDTDFEHPNARGYKLYLKYGNTTYVSYPQSISPKGIPYDLQLVPATDYSNACSLWKDRQFRFRGTKIGYPGIEIEAGTMVRIIEVVPKYYDCGAVRNGSGSAKFLGTFILPSGQTVRSDIDPKLLQLQ